MGFGFSVPVNKLSDEQDRLTSVYKYHDRSKHLPGRYSRSLGYMDWSSQPDPFRRYHQATRITLNQSPSAQVLYYDSLFDNSVIETLPVNQASISRLFYESLAISAWKKAGDSTWSLRVNPSSGNLHPTEAYLITGPVNGLADQAAVYHYSAYQHALERRILLKDVEWQFLMQKMPSECLLIALTSIYWRESWKYGERAFRYCHHDIGHAIGAIAFAAASMGWTTRLIPSVRNDELEMLLGISDQVGVEKECSDCLLAIFPFDAQRISEKLIFTPSSRLLERLNTSIFEGKPNILSVYHHDWPVIDELARACAVDDCFQSAYQNNHDHSGNAQTCFYNDRCLPVSRLIRKRRSAQAMDASVIIADEVFYRIMTHVMPDCARRILNVLPWQPCVSLVVFVHRVEGIPAGLYLLVRDPGHKSLLQSAFHSDFNWDKPNGCPDHLPFYQLELADTRKAAEFICCHQEIASQGVFSLGMLAQFDASLQQYGASFYPRLFWETGLIGQILYLEAGAAGVSATGIGCFFDDMMHEVLGIGNHGWQSLYHFTVGAALEDPRLQTLPSYWHLAKEYTGDGP